MTTPGEAQGQSEVADSLAQRQSEALARTLQLSTTEPDLDRFLGQVLLTMAEALRSPAASLWFYNSSTQIATLHLFCEDGIVRGAEEFHAMPREATARDFPYLLRLEREQRPFVLSDIPHTPLIGDERNRRWMVEHGVKSFLKVPLLLGGHFIGNVAVQNNEREEFSPEEIQLAEALGVQVSLAVQLTRLADESQAAALTREREQAAQERARELERINARLQAEIIERRGAETVAQGQMAALLKTFARMSEAPAIDNVVASVMRATIEQLGQDSGGLWLWDEAAQTTILTIDYEDNQVKHGVQIIRPGGAHDVQRAWDDGFLLRLRAHEILVQDVEAEWTPGSHNQRRGIRTRTVLPLFFGDEFLGNLTLRSKLRRSYSPSEMELAGALASQVALAVQLTRLADEAQQAAVLDERNRIAREIHDTLAQAFTAIAVHLEAVSVIAPPGQVRELVERARDLAREGVGEARRGLYALRPGALENSDFARALHRTVERAGEAGNASPHLSCHIVGTPLSLLPRVEDHLLRVAQEALNNALRHAAPSRVEVVLEFATNRLRLCVRDDGCGFDLEEAKRGDGLGLIGMRERMAELGGGFEVVTRPGQGTEVRVEVPSEVKR